MDRGVWRAIVHGVTKSRIQKKKELDTTEQLIHTHTIVASVTKLFLRIKSLELKWSGTLWSLPHPHILTLSFVCGKTLTKK